MNGADRPPELGGLPGASPCQNGNARLARGRGHQDPVVRDVLDPPGGGAEDERVPHPGLVHSSPRPARPRAEPCSPAREHAEQAPVRDGPVAEVNIRRCVVETDSAKTAALELHASVAFQVAGSRLVPRMASRTFEVCGQSQSLTKSRKPAGVRVRSALRSMPLVRSRRKSSGASSSWAVSSPL